MPSGEESEPSWDDLLGLHVVRRLSELIRRRFGSAPSFARGEGDAVGGARLIGAPPHARDAVEAARFADGVAAFEVGDGRAWRSAPIRLDGQLAGCAYAAADATADLGLLDELLGLIAEEMAVFHRDLERPGQRVASDRKGGSLPQPRYRYDAIIGRSRAVQDLLRLLDKVIESESTVLIAGENGTGKELVARAIHQNSRRAGERFVVQNCSAFNDNLLDSELFGHKKGSFTGAVADKQGLFEVADRGTFFLDEIGDMSAALQVKLLRVLQEGTFNPVGDTVTRLVDVRILAASNRDLKRMVDRGEFREDLYYRVNVINLTCPALRERRDDIPILIEHFLRKNARGRRLGQKRLTRGCIDRLCAYPWPGNVRELENEVERLVVLAGDDKLIGEELLSPRLQRPRAEPERGSLGDTVDAVERQAIHDALLKHAWNKTRAAEELRISRRNLIRKVEKYQLDQRRAR